MSIILIICIDILYKNFLGFFLNKTRGRKTQSNSLKLLLQNLRVTKHSQSALHSPIISSIFFSTSLMQSAPDQTVQTTVLNDSHLHAINLRSYLIDEMSSCVKIACMFICYPISSR